LEAVKMEDEFSGEFTDEASEKDDFYSSNMIEGSIEDDEISAVEEGFMQGYMNS